ncbi:MAG: c-type cytochrome [Gemmatimonadales bacterium]|nr:c-type cytochrome [Gemmatimonadales bacterium]
MRLLLPTLVLGLVVLPATMLTPDVPRAQQAQDTLQPKRDSAVAAIRRQIAGKEELPAKEVFTNLKLLGDMPAGRLLNVMNGGYSRNLGVTCDYCHNTEDYGSDEKKEKETARAMVTMVGTIAAELGKITTIKSERPVVNCGTCHRGVPRPGVRPGA